MQTKKAREIPVTRIFKQNQEARESIVVNRGGARSSKSHSIAQLFISELTTGKNKSLLITRKTFPSLRISAYRLVIDLLKDYGYYPYCHHDKTEKSLTWPNNNWLLFSSIDDPEKIKSTEWNKIWMEEATDFNYEDFRILQLRLSKPKQVGEYNQLYMSFNPIDAFHWIKEKLIDPEMLKNEEDRRLIEIVSTYKDNPFLPQDYIDMLLTLKEVDINYWHIYGEGEWGVLENLIYHNWDTINPDRWPTEFSYTIYGLDFGFNAPSALIKIGVKDNEPYERELLYESGLTNTELIEQLEDLIPNKKDYIFADTAEPARIEEISQAGFNIYPADKSVKDGIDYVKSQKVHIHQESDNLIKEKRGYKYKENRDKQVLDEPLKFNDHLMDAERYALYTFHVMFGEGEPWQGEFGIGQTVASGADW